MCVGVLLVVRVAAVAAALSSDATPDVQRTYNRLGQIASIATLDPSGGSPILTTTCSYDPAALRLTGEALSGLIGRSVNRQYASGGSMRVGRPTGLTAWRCDAEQAAGRSAGSRDPVMPDSVPWRSSVAATFAVDRLQETNTFGLV